MQVQTVSAEISPYTRKVSRGRSIRITIRAGGVVVVHAPPHVPEHVVKRFVDSKTSWIEKTAARLCNVLPPISKREQKKEYEAYKESARTLAHARVAYFAQHYGVQYGRIAIRNQQTRWGSCSRRGNLNFSYKIAYLPPELADYIVVHEVCHLREFNHSEHFWALVSETMPHYKAMRKSLKNEGRMTKI